MEVFRSPGVDAVVVFPMLDSTNTDLLKAGLSTFTVSGYHYSQTSGVGHGSNSVSYPISEETTCPGMYNISIPAADMVSGRSFIIRISSTGAKSQIIMITTLGADVNLKTVEGTDATNYFDSKSSALSNQMTTIETAISTIETDNMASTRFNNLMNGLTAIEADSAAATRFNSLITTLSDLEIVLGALETDSSALSRFTDIMTEIGDRTSELGIALQAGVPINTVVQTDIVTVEGTDVSTYFDSLRTLITSDIITSISGSINTSPVDVEYDYPIELLVPFKKLIKAAILQNRVVMDTANIATQHRMAYLAMIGQLNMISQVLDSIVPAIDQTTFTIAMSPMLILSVLSAVTSQYYLNSDVGNLVNQSDALTEYQTFMSKIATAAIQFDVDVNWYTTWGKQR